MKLVGVMLLGILLIFAGCKEPEPVDPPAGPEMSFIFRFDPGQERLDNLGNPAPLPAGHAAQSPDFNGMAAHYIELSPTQWTQVGQGTVLYKSPETSQGGDKAIQFDSLLVADEGTVFFSVPLEDIPPGTYEYLRISLAYQNYDVDFRVTYQGTPLDLRGTIASFVGYNSYISTYKIKTMDDVVDANKLQGYWAFETHPSGLVPATVSRGQAPGTTVVNPIAATSPIAPGSCLVTGRFDPPLIISGEETNNIRIAASLSINQSFEWEDGNGNGKFEPLDGEQVVDMGIRGLVPEMY
jgi:hypothetical protein